MEKNYFSGIIECKLELFFNRKYILLLATLTILLGNVGTAQTTVTITTTGSSTWTVPPGVSGTITVEAWGAGGSGGGATGKGKGGSGGTGGTYVSTTFSGVTSGTIYNLFIAPSTSGTLSANGTNGQGTWFNTAGTLFANGGLGGLAGNGAGVIAVNTGSIGTTITAGGSTSAGTAILGSSGGAGGNGGGAGGASVGAAGSNSFINGNPGTAAGGGGGGSTVGGGGGSNSTGGTGAQGQIKITFTCPANAGTLSGTQTICLGGTSTFSSTVLDGTWSSSNTGIATINSSTGVITSVSAGGPVTMTYTIASGSCTTRTATRTLTVNALSIAPTSITGTSSICIGQSTTLTLSGGTAGTGAVAEWFTGSCGGTSAGTGNSITVSPTGTTTYFVRYNGTCNTTTCASVTVTVNPLPVLTAITGTTSVCIGSTTTLSNSTSSGTWNSASTGVATINSSGVVSGVTAGTSLITYTYTNVNNCTSSVNTTVTVDALPVVTSASSVCIGSTIQLTPNSGGTWTSSDNTIATIDNSGLVNGVAVGSVTFTFTNSTTNCSKTTNGVSVLELPAISLQPTATQTVCSGSSISFSVTATGAGLSYQWYNGATSLNNGGAISGATSATLTINPVSLTDASANYNCIVSGTCSPTATSTNAELIVIEKVTIITQPIATQTYCTGDTAIFSVTATGAGITYQWYKGATALTDGGTISGATTNSLSISTLAISDAAVNYYCLVSGTSPCSAVASSNSILNINQSPTITGQPIITQTVCQNGTVSFSIIASGGSLIYQWYKGGTLLNNGGNISGATSTTLTINPVALSDAASDYNCVVSNGCVGTDISNNAALIVSPIALIPIQSLSTCSQSGFSITPLDGVPNAGTIVPSNTTYSWSAPIVTGGITGGAGLSVQTAITGTLNNPTEINQTATYTVTPTSGITPTCSGSNFTVTVTVSPKPSIQNVVTTICTDETFTITPTNGSGNIIPSGTTYSWGLPSVTGGITGATIGSNQTSIIQTLSNPTTAVQTATYTITPLSGSCTGATFTLTVTVNPNPVTSVNLATQTACTGNTFSPIIITNTNNLATTYSWTRDNTTNVSGTVSGTSALIAAGSSFSLSQILTNNTTAAQTVIYTFIPNSNGCIGNSVTSTVVVNVSSVGGTASSSLPGVTPVVRTITECHFATGTVYVSGHIGNIIRWEYTTNGGVLWLPITNATVSNTYNNITQTTLFRAVIQNGNSCNLAYSLVTRVNVVPNIKPSPVFATPSTICLGNSSTLSSESGFATSSYVATGGTFSNANPDNWLVDGCGNCLNASGSNTSAGPFRLSATNGGTYEGINYASSGKFAIASGNFNSIMQTPIFNTFGLPSATLTFNHAFNLQTGASVSIELSLDGGTTYSVVLAQYFGASSRSPYNAFPLETIDLSNYIGQANLKVRFVYNGNANSSWAIDNIIIPETPSNLETEWVDTSTGLIISTSSSVVVSPTRTTTYAITSHLNGCTSFGPDGTTYVTVTVNPRPSANIGPSQTICNGGTATFSVALTGVSPWRVTYSNGTTSTTVNNITTNPYVFSVAGITVNQTYTITALSDSRCTSIAQDLTGSAVVTVLNGTAGLWTGLVSNDWFDCKNWAGGLPSATINAQIPNGSPRMPLIDPSTSSFAVLYGNIARAQDIIIANSASATMATNSNLYISRDWKNSGSFIPGQGTVTFNSATLNQVQTINLGIKSNETFYNLTLNNTNSAKGISVVDGFELTISNNLSLLSGDLRLVGEAQMVQNGTPANPSAGTGKILKDQQGNRSSYHYNYWSSPVTTSGINYSIGGVLRDGTDSTSNPFNPSAITFGGGAYFADGAITNPVKISTSWLYKFTSVSTVYAGWQFVGNAGTINPAEGFTMKGVTGIAPFTVPQNYVFVGKPNNGTIALNISLNQSYLVGNPYPSALDADEFIKDNVKDNGGRAATNIFNGALYFWDHFGGQTHILNQYIGGYSTYTLMGGVVAISNDPLVNANGSMGTKVPKRYIPVAQGFFIGTGSNAGLTTNNPNQSTAVTGGAITFKNSQRVFKVESASNSIFFRSQNNQTTVDSTDIRQKIRLLYQSPSNLFRQILVGVDENTTNFFDIGYDAPMIDENAEDLYWNIDTSKFTIQAVSNFNADQIIPFGIKTATDGVSTIKIASLENISENTPVFIHDNETNTDTNIKNGDFTISLPIGVYNNRFSIRFSGNALGTTHFENINPIIYFTNSNNLLIIKNKYSLKTVQLYNLLGQLISKYDVQNETTGTIEIPLYNLSSGTYIVKTITDENTIFSQKIIKN